MSLNLGGYEIVLNPLEEVLCTFATYLFNQSYYFRQQPCKEHFSFYLINKRNGWAYARFILFIEADKGISPCRGTFGSVEANPLLPAEYLDFFINSINEFAVRRQLKQIAIKAYPFCYAPEVSANITAALLRHDYLLLNTELNNHILITNKPFTNKLHISERRRLYKCLQQGFVVDEEKKPDLATIYELILQTRLRRNYPVTLNYDEFTRLFRDFPQVYKLFTVRDENKIIASTVAVIINHNILYYFLPADDVTYRTYSPMVLLMKGLYDYCQMHKFKILDLGISTDKGIPNYGLMHFKQNLGAQTSLKLSFVKYFV